MAQASMSSQKVSTKRQQSNLVKAYLLGYNLFQFAGWSTIFGLSIKSVIENNGIENLWKDVSLWVQVFQTAAILEVLHSAIGIIPSSVFMTFMQVHSRVFLVWGIITPVKQAQLSYGIPCSLTAWTITEMIRYSYYCLNLFSLVPNWLTWCRYTFFIVLYPMGVLGEILCMFSALPYLRSTQKWSIDLPNRFNVSFSYYYYVMLLMVMYIPGFPQLYFYMLAQRKKMLGTKKSD